MAQTIGKFQEATYYGYQTDFDIFKTHLTGIEANSVYYVYDGVTSKYYIFTGTEWLPM